MSHAIGRVTGHPVDHDAVRDQARREAEKLSVVEFATPLTQRMDERDAHRDRHLGIDERSRVEAAKCAIGAGCISLRRLPARTVGKFYKEYGYEQTGITIGKWSGSQADMTT